MNPEKEKPKKTISEKITNFSDIYLAHHPICDECRNHVFKIGPLYLCVGCTSVISGFLIFGIFLFSFLDFFYGFPLFVALITSYGVLMSLIQLFSKPKNKWLKVLMRFSLGLGMGAFLALIVFLTNWFLKFGLLFLLIIGTFLYNNVRNYSHLDDCIPVETVTQEEDIGDSDIQLIDS